MALFTAIGAGLAYAAAGTTTAALIGGGIGLQAAGAYSQSKNNKQMAAYNKGVALTNEQIAKDNAADVVDRGRVAVFDQRRAVARELGKVRAATAGAGLVVDEAGTTPQDMVDSMVQAGELDVMRLANNIEREERRALIQGAGFAAQAGQFELQRASESPFRSALTSAAGSIASPGNADILFG